VTGLEALSRRIVTEYGLAAGETIEEVRAGPYAATVVTSLGGHRVEQVASADDLGVDVYVLGSSTTDTGGPLTGLALAPGGRLHRLDDPEALRDLWRHGGTALRPAGMARLVAAWAGTQDGPRPMLDPDGAPLVEETDGTGRTHVALRTGRGDDVERWDVVLGPDLLRWRRRRLEPWDREPWRLET
jgi:hypothetical protein